MAPDRVVYSHNPITREVVGEESEVQGQPGTYEILSQKEKGREEGGRMGERQGGREKNRGKKCAMCNSSETLRLTLTLSLLPLGKLVAGLSKRQTKGEARNTKSLIQT